MNPATWWNRFWAWRRDVELAREQRQTEALEAFCKLVVSIGSRLNEEDIQNAKTLLGSE